MPPDKKEAFSASYHISFVSFSNFEQQGGYLINRPIFNCISGGKSELGLYNLLTKCHTAEVRQLADRADNLSRFARSKLSNGEMPFC